MYDALMYIFLLVAAVGSFSHNWGRVCLIMFISSALYMLVHHVLLTPWPFDIKYLGYFGAFMSCLFGIMVTKYYAIPVDVSYREKQTILLSVIAIGILYLVEFTLTFYNQFIFNIGLSKGSLIAAIFQPAVFTITALQTILLLKGGKDGLQRIGSDIGYLWAAHYPNIANTHTSQEIQRERKEL